MTSGKVTLRLSRTDRAESICESYDVSGAAACLVCPALTYQRRSVLVQGAKGLVAG